MCRRSSKFQSTNLAGFILYSFHQILRQVFDGGWVCALQLHSVFTAHRSIPIETGIHSSALLTPCVASSWKNTDARGSAPSTGGTMQRRSLFCIKLSFLTCLQNYDRTAPVREENMVNNMMDDWPQSRIDRGSLGPQELY